MGNLVSVTDDKGYSVSIELMCTFSLMNEVYAVYYSGGNAGLNVDRISYSVWDGTVLHVGEVDPEAVSTAKMLIERNASRPETYAFDGEHYRIYEKTMSDGSRKRVISKNENGLDRFRMLGVSVPVFLKLAYSMLIAVCFYSAYIRFCMLFPSLIFTEMSGSDISSLIRGVALFGCCALFVLCKKQDVFHLTVNGIAPLSAITLAAGFANITWLKIAIILTAVALLALRVIPLAVSTVRSTVRHKSLQNLLVGAHEIVSTVSVYMVIAALVVCSTAFTGGFSEVIAPETPPRPEAVIENYESVLTKLDPEIWRTLSLEDKQSVLKKIGDYECEYVLGIDPVFVTVDKIGDDTLYGLYSHDKKEVKLNTHIVEASVADDAVETLLHELRHSWQHALIDMYDDIKPHLKDEHRVISVIRDAVNFNKDLCDLYDDTYNFPYYLMSATEQDSRSWAFAELITNYGSYLGIMRTP